MLVRSIDTAMHEGSFKVTDCFVLTVIGSTILADEHVNILHYPFSASGCISNVIFTRVEMLHYVAYHHSSSKSLE